MNKLTAPFPYFGGESTIAGMVWGRLGDVKHYMEPFFGSGAVLLARPDYRPGDHIETICDRDGFVANVWRSLQADPDAVAKVCDWPVNHADLSARRRWLLTQEAELLKRLIADPDWYDVRAAGYWIWAASCWIGSGLTRVNAIPDVATSGEGVHKLGKRPNVGNGGEGVHKLGQRFSADDEVIGVQAPYNTNLYTWFRQLSERLRYVRVVCGDWTRICGGDWQDGKGTAGIFFDPPYGVTDRDTSLYQHDSTAIAAEVMAWARERGRRPTYRIVLAGYEEYAELLGEGWTSHGWKSGGGYGNLRRGEEKNEN